MITDLRGGGIDWSGEQAGVVATCPCGCGCPCDCNCTCNCLCIDIAPDGDLSARSYPDVNEHDSTFGAQQASTSSGVMSNPEVNTVMSLFSWSG